MSDQTIGAELWRRTASWAIDVALALTLATIVSRFDGGTGVLVLAVGAPAYYVALVGLRGGQTVGHRAVGITVRDDRDGSAIGPYRAAMRLAVAVLLLIPFAVPIVLSAIGITRRSDRRAWHDLATDSVLTAR